MHLPFSIMNNNLSKNQSSKTQKKNKANDWISSIWTSTISPRCSITLPRESLCLYLDWTSSVVRFTRRGLFLVLFLSRLWWFGFDLMVEGQSDFLVSIESIVFTKLILVGASGLVFSFVRICSFWFNISSKFWSLRYFRMEVRILYNQLFWCF